MVGTYLHSSVALVAVYTYRLTLCFQENIITELGIPTFDRSTVERKYKIIKSDDHYNLILILCFIEKY